MDDLVSQPSVYIRKILTALEDEKVKHSQTKKQYQKTSKKLEFALDEIKILNQQLRSEQEVFRQAFENLKDTAYQQKCQSSLLKNKYKETKHLFDVQILTSSSKDKEIEQLKYELSAQKKLFKISRRNEDIYLQQERFLAQNYYSS